MLRALAIALLFTANIPLNLFYWHSSLGDFEDRWWSGNAGIDLFLAISGFVIGGALLPRLQDCEGAVACVATVLTFLLRRFWRILPAAVLWLAIPLVLSLVFNRSGAFHPFGANLASAATALLGVNNLRLGALLPPSDAGITFPYWVLSLQEQFYVLLPVACLILRRRLVWLMLGLLAWQFVMPETGLVERPGALAAGVLLALWHAHPDYAMTEPRFLARGRIIRATVLLLFVVLLGALRSPLPAPLVVLPYGLIALLCGALVYAASFGRGYVMPPGLARSACVWVGGRAFAIGLVHLPAFAATRELFVRLLPPPWGVTTLMAAEYVGAALALTLLAAELTYRLVERPCRRYGRSIRIAAPVAACI